MEIRQEGSQDYLLLLATLMILILWRMKWAINMVLAILLTVVQAIVLMKDPHLMHTSLEVVLQLWPMPVFVRLRTYNPIVTIIFINVVL